jgi:hypothetical protein
MPWYEAKPRSKTWGWHWTMNAFDPDTQVNGQPQIASHYYPLIGPYDSRDQDVLEFHTLLMRLAGIDGVIVDWYGHEDYLDYALLHRNASALIQQAAQVGLKFAVCYEDETIPKLVAAGRVPKASRVVHARKELQWLRDNWFREPGYVSFQDRPVLLSFGQSGLTDEEWARVLQEPPQAPRYLSEHRRRSAAAGAFDWPIPAEGLTAQREFLARARTWPVAMAVAIPRFHDIYAQAKVQKSLGRIEDDSGRTFATTLQSALSSNLPFVQICTWNDWGEGTQIEPSVEFGYRDLEQVQRLRRQYIEPGFAVTASQLGLPHRLFKLRKTGGAAFSKTLDEAAALLAARSPERAQAILDKINEP